MASSKSAKIHDEFNTLKPLWLFFLFVFFLHVPLQRKLVFAKAWSLSLTG